MQIAKKEQVEALIIAGDIFDKANPSATAIQQFDEFLNLWAELNLPIFIISGNHDSAERIAFGKNIFAKNQVYISPVYDGNITTITLQDDYGKLNFYLLPFIKPAIVQQFFPDEKIDSYNKAVKVALSNLSLKEDERNILIAHQFVTGAYCCDSEEIVVGGLDNIDVSLFDSFDYVALGHIHTPQYIKRDTVRYCGTALKYSFSESEQIKSVTIIDFLEKGKIQIHTHELKPLHDMRKLKGTYDELTARKNYIDTDTQDYLSITLTDEEDIPDAVNKLRTIYPNIMQLNYDNTRTRYNQQINVIDVKNMKSPLELFNEFYYLQNNKDLNSEQKHIVAELVDEIWEVK